ncbi:hypothetical protein [uncultured Fibrobacter sp.]|uniref:hypothetical protein n=1 Tax=uncultured Fibrobacter sp. TaxID=261512 RepID=UPI002804EFAD|nr:hypothetical protein [uncultured Fibrobacter sp.]
MKLSKIFKFYRGDRTPKYYYAEAGRLCDAEHIFHEDFLKFENSDWFAFFTGRLFEGKDAADFFIKKLKDPEEHDRPLADSEGWIFKLWLDSYLFVDKFSPEWRKIYNDPNSQKLA